MEKPWNFFGKAWNFLGKAWNFLGKAWRNLELRVAGGQNPHPSLSRHRAFDRTPVFDGLCGRGDARRSPPLPQLALAANPCAHGQSRSSPAAAARGAHRRSPSRGARGALSRLCALHHHGPGAARRARRAEARASAHPLRHAHPQARSRHRLQEMRQDRRRRDGLVPSRTATRRSTRRWCASRRIFPRAIR